MASLYEFVDHERVYDEILYVYYIAMESMFLITQTFSYPSIVYA